MPAHGKARAAACIAAVFLGLLAAGACAAAEGDEGSPSSATPRRFFRFGIAGIHPNTRSSDARDITGPVLRSTDHPILPLLAPGMDAFGIPANSRVDVRDGFSVFGSVGQFLDDHWAIEGLVLAWPFQHDVVGTGTIAHLGKVATVKQLPPTLILQRYFNDFDAAWRPSLGIGINYTRFFEARATPALEAYTGGPTSIKMKPSWGLGVFAGLQHRLSDRLHINLTLGYVNVRTTATMITRDTMLSGSSPVLYDYPYPVNQIPTDPVSREAMDNLVRQVAAQRGGSLGTFERQIDTRLNPYVVLLSMGYSF